jgi:type IX secretion system PorP/SprF family membrane protein
MLLLASANLWAQQDAQFSMNMFNRQIANPAYVGAPGVKQLTLASRSQWVGIEGHPNTFTGSFNLPVTILRGGLGIHMIHDRIGPFTTTNIYGSYAFKIPVGTNGSALQLGISPGLMLKNLNAENFRSKDAALLDPVLRELVGRVVSQNVFDLNAGVYYYVPSRNPKDPIDKLYIGFNVNHLLQPKLGNFSSPNNNSDNVTRIHRNFGIMGGYRFGDGPISFVPNLFLRFGGVESPFTQSQIDLVGNLHIMPMVFGIGYRGLTNASDLIALAGFHASQRLFIAYSYDYAISGLNAVTSGSHEIVMQYTFPTVFRFYPPNLDVRRNPILR